MTTISVRLVICIIFISMITTMNSFSQTIKIDENKVSVFANEVFKNCMQYATPEYYESYKRKIQSIEIVKLSDLQNTNIEFRKLKDVMLKNKCNYSLQYDNASNFSPENFNPLKYFFLRTYEPAYYTIEGVEYVIKVTTNY